MPLRTNELPRFLHTVCCHAAVLAGVGALQIRRLRAKMDHIIKEYEYQQEREEAFRNTSESTNARVQWWSIIQSAIMVSAGVWQVLHLRTFFMRKKLM